MSRSVDIASDRAFGFFTGTADRDHNFATIEAEVRSGNEAVKQFQDWNKQVPIAAGLLRARSIWRR